MELLTIQETADILKVSPVTVRRFIRSRRLPAVRVGRALRVKREDVEKLPSPVQTEHQGDGARDKSWGFFTKDDPLWQLVGAFGGESDEPNDVSSDKYKYLAEAYADLHEDK